MAGLTCGASQPVARISGASELPGSFHAGAANVAADAPDVAAAAREFLLRRARGEAEGAAQPAAGVHGAVRDMVAEILKLGRMPRQNKHAKTKAERYEQALANRYSKHKSKISDRVQRAIKQLGSDASARAFLSEQLGHALAASAPASAAQPARETPQLSLGNASQLAAAASWPGSAQAEGGSEFAVIDGRVGRVEPLEVSHHDAHMSVLRVRRLEADYYYSYCYDYYYY